MHYRTQTAAIALLLTASCAIPTAQSPLSSPVNSPPPITAPTPDDLWSQMRSGTGYVVLMRHAQTEPGTGDPPGFQLEDCATQRNLSAEGRTQAERIGNTFRNRQIPIAQVRSSQYCRCLDTAKLLNLGTVEPDPMLNSTFEDRSTEAAQTEQVRQEILNHRNNAGVIIMVTHFVNVGAISGISPPAGDAVVMKANPEGDLEVVGQLQNL
jgi:phosphohistidine phosphatase SixA